MDKEKLKKIQQQGDLLHLLAEDSRFNYDSDSTYDFVFQKNYTELSYGEGLEDQSIAVLVADRDGRKCEKHHTWKKHPHIYGLFVSYPFRDREFKKQLVRELYKALNCEAIVVDYDGHKNFWETLNIPVKFPQNR